MSASSLFVRSIRKGRPPEPAGGAPLNERRNFRRRPGTGVKGPPKREQIGPVLAQCASVATGQESSSVVRSGVKRLASCADVENDIAFTSDVFAVPFVPATVIV